MQSFTIPNLKTDHFSAILTVTTLLLVISYAFFFHARNKSPDAHPLRIREQSSVTPIRQSNQESSVYRSVFTGEKAPLLASLDDSILTLSDAALRAQQMKSLLVKHYDSGLKKVVSKNWAELMQDTRKMAQGLASLQDKNSALSESNLIILLEPCLEWFVVYLTCVRNKIAFVPLQHTESETNISLILNHSKITTIITNSAWATILSKYNNSSFNIIVAQANDSPLPKAKAHRIISIDDFLQSRNSTSAEDFISAPTIKPKDIAYILYEKSNSGSVSAHAISNINALSTLGSYVATIPGKTAFKTADNVMILESLADPTALNLLNVALYFGSTISLSKSDNTENLIEEMGSLQPSVAYFPPAILKDFANLVSEQTKKMPMAEVYLFKKALNFATFCVDSGFLPGFSFWDFAYFHHFRRFVGGKVKVIYTVGNDLPQTVSYIRKIFGCQVLSTGGTASINGAIACSMFGDYKQEKYPSIGPPLPCCEVKLIDYSNKTINLKTSKSNTVDKNHNPSGQICVRGANVSTSTWSSAGYEPRTLTDGWLKTGILGSFLPNRTLQLLSNDFVRNYPISHLEKLCLDSLFVSDAIVSTLPKNHHPEKLVVVVYPRPFELYLLAAKSKQPFMFKNIATNEWCQKLVYDDIWKILVGAGLNFLDKKTADSSSNKLSLEVRLTGSRFTRSNNYLNSDGSPNRDKI